MLPKAVAEKIKTHRFLITGGAGFIGSNIAVRLLREGAEKVVVLDDLSTGFDHNLDEVRDHSRFMFIRGDIRDPAICRIASAEVNIILHQAALGSVPRSIADPAATNAVNVDGFLNMLNAARENNVRRFIYASSSSVYGNDRTMPKTENKTGELLSPYAVTKFTNEKYAKVFSSVYGMETIGLRYFNVFGPHQNPKGPYAAVIPLFMQAMMKNEQPAIFGDGKNTRDFTFIENVVNANILAAFAPVGKDSPVMNIAFGGTTSLNDLYNILAEVIGFSLPPRYMPERKGDIKDSFADISLAKHLLGYAPVIGLEEGLAATVDWYKTTMT